jgi:hypothetical protein
MKRESYSDEIVNLSEEVEFESRSRGNSTHESLSMGHGALRMYDKLVENNMIVSKEDLELIRDLRRSLLEANKSTKLYDGHMGQWYEILEKTKKYEA